jgi:large subunit ribosomal protein L2
MGIKVRNPKTPSTRFTTYSDFADITKSEPERRLTEHLKKWGGRCNTGRLTVRHVGGGHKKRYRKIDFKRRKDGIEAVVEHIEYDPNRSSRIALLKYKDGERRYILLPIGLKVGDKVVSGEKVEARTGNCMPLKNIPTGLYVHCVELTPGKGGQIVRSAGSFGQLLAKEGNYAHVLLPSGEIRQIHQNCRAVIGQVGNIEHSLITIGKAGRKRHMGIRPTVRGTAMNPVSHPNGGGEGRKIGKPPVSVYGQIAKGGITRNWKKPSSRFIVRMRRSGSNQVRKGS